MGVKTHKKVRTSGWAKWRTKKQTRNESADMKEGYRRPSAQRW
jgi:hypothetical protein